MTNNKKDWILDEDGDKLLKKSEFNLSETIHDRTNYYPGIPMQVIAIGDVKEFIAKIKANIYPLIKSWDLVYEINEEIDKLAGDKLK